MNYKSLSLQWERFISDIIRDNLIISHTMSPIINPTITTNPTRNITTEIATSPTFITHPTDNGADGGTAGRVYVVATV